MDNQDELIGRCERLLEAVKAGEVRNLVICFDSIDDPTKWASWYSRGLGFPTMVGYLELAFLDWKVNYLRRDVEK